MMKKKRFLQTSILVFILTLLLGGAVLAQSPITAQVDRNALTTDDVLRLTVTVQSQALNVPEPAIPPMDGFNVVGRSTSTQLSMINGVVSSSISFVYTLQPYQTGDLTIPALSVTLDGQTYQTNPIPVSVTQGTGVPSQSSGSSNSPDPAPAELGRSKYYAEAEVSNPNPYVGEQLVYTFRFYQAAGSGSMLDQPQYQGPSFTGFWSENELQQSSFSTQVDNVIYQANEIHTILFPTAAGEVTIDAARIIVPPDLFDVFASEVMLETDPIAVDVQPLPAGAPDIFNGAVGRYTIQSQVDTQQTVVNEPLTRRITISGAGNLDNLPDPQWPDLPGWRTFDSTSNTTTEIRDGVVVGSKIFEQLLIPQRAGQFTLPPVEYAFLNPETDQYETISTESVEVSVTPAAGQAPVAPLTNANNAAVAPISNDGLQPLKSTSTLLAASTVRLTDQLWYWLLWLLPLGFVVAGVAWPWYRHHRLQNPEKIRASQALKKARHTLSQRQDDPYTTAHQVLLDYLGDKFNRSFNGLTKNGLRRALTAQGLDTPLLNQIDALIMATEAGRFSPGGQPPDIAAQLSEQVLNTLNALEKEL